MAALTRWTNPSLPQTLQIGMFLLYIDAVFGLLFGTVLAFPIGTAIVVGSAAAGLGIANEMKWGWVLGVVVSVVSLVFAVLLFASVGFSAVISLAFAVAQLLLLVHPQSREHQRVWFQ
ncbi:MAG: hypothetical protein GXY13_02855 [Acidimicrobiales bacterium]|nr:hypothetical protein [Acidimicrobiales bacterium]